MDYVIRKNKSNGVRLNGGKAPLRCGAISENEKNGVHADSSAKVTVAKADEGKPQTVSKDNTIHDWCPYRTDGSEIIGIPQEKLNVRNDL